MTKHEDTATLSGVGSSDVLYGIDFGKEDFTVVRCTRCGWYSEVKKGHTCLEEWQKHKCREPWDVRKNGTGPFSDGW